MKHLPAVLILLLQALSGFANMASPVRPGTTLLATAFSSRNIDILHETIRIDIDSDFTYARYAVEYLVDVPEGMQIPLLFVAKNLEQHLDVWVDDRPQAVLPVPDTLGTRMPALFNGIKEGMPGAVYDAAVIDWGNYSTGIYALNELQYFETALSKGQHRIRVAYKAGVWEDLSDWLICYSHRYSLSPARHWRSFHALDVILKSDLPRNITLSTNLGTPQQRDSISHWHFDKLPGDYIAITLQPQVSSFAQTMMHSGPEGFTGIAAVLLVSLHLYAIYRFRKARPGRKYSPVLILGSFIVPFLVLGAYVQSFSWIDILLEPYASGRHGYVFLIFIFYPFLLPVYFLLLWLADRLIKKRLNMAKPFTHL